MVTSVPTEDTSLRMCDLTRGGTQAFRTLTAQIHESAMTLLHLAHTQLSDKVDQACQETSRLSALATGLLCHHHRFMKPIQPAVQVAEKDMRLSLTVARTSLPERSG